MIVHQLVVLEMGDLIFNGFPVLYGSPDLQVCIHECRVTEEDDLYVATLAPTVPLRLINLAVLLRDGVVPISEFKSLDIAIHMLFLAGSHSYDITRQISSAAQSAGFDGLIYPSYFSLLRIGVPPFGDILWDFAPSYPSSPEIRRIKKQFQTSQYLVTPSKKVKFLSNVLTGSHLIR